MLAAPRRVVEAMPQPGRCLVMGIINVTPDSFSDGGAWLAPTDAIAHGEALLASGADVLDIGGESTRPGARRPDLEEELARVIPVISTLSAGGAILTIDTMRADVARAAVEAGATGVNDVSGGLADPAMLGTVAELAVPYICMHWRAHSTMMQQLATYDDVVAEVSRELGDRIEAALGAGISPGRLAIDPGLGFAKTADHNWTLLRNLQAILDLGYPVVVGASRKAFLGDLLKSDDGVVRPAAEREDATTAISTFVAAEGAWCVRVHDAQRSRDAIAVVSRMAREGAQ